ncbi:MAG TPA: hypothetical protein VH092_00755, partial [Urbifossiella sp.]|nr:hypothetical protein [Urbifossiella sp.]
MPFAGFFRPASVLRLGGRPAGGPEGRRTPRPKHPRAVMVRRGRVAVVGGLLLFILLQLGFFPLSQAWPAVQDGEYGHKLRNLRRQVWAKPADQPAVVMFGSSLT